MCYPNVCCVLYYGMVFLGPLEASCSLFSVFIGVDTDKTPTSSIRGDHCTNKWLVSYVLVHDMCIFVVMCI